MAPEQLMGKPIDRRADLFAVGVILWELLARTRLVEKGADDIAVVTRRIHGNERRIRDVVPDAPDPVVAICEKAMALDASDRFATAGAMRDAIDAYLEHVGNCESRHVAALLDEHFKEERSKVKLIVGANARASQASLPRIGIRSTTISSTASTEVPLPLAREVSVTTKATSRALPSSLAAVALLGAAVGIYRWGNGQASTMTHTEPVNLLPRIQNNATVSPPETLSPTPFTKSASSSIGSQSFNVRITTNPSGALLRLDGNPVSNPYDGTLLARPHRLHAEATGFRPLERDISEYDDSRVTLTLSPLTTPERRDDALPKPISTRPQKLHRSIDDADPYK